MLTIIVVKLGLVKVSRLLHILLVSPPHCKVWKLLLWGEGGPPLVLSILFWVGGVGWGVLVLLHGVHTPTRQPERKLPSLESDKQSIQTVFARQLLPLRGLDSSHQVAGQGCMAHNSSPVLVLKIPHEI